MAHSATAVANGVGRHAANGCWSDGDTAKILNGGAPSDDRSHRSGTKASPVKDKYEMVTETADFLLSKTKHRPLIAIVCGTGLGGIGELVKDCDTIPYEIIPNFVATGVKGHSGKLLFGQLSGKCVVCMQGRFHGFEGHSMWQITFPIRVFHRIGIRILMVTNASGSINPDYSPGDIMIMRDHINLPGFTGNNPLVGLNDERFGIRFPAMSNAYDGPLRALLRRVAVDELKLTGIREGVYVCNMGPCYETVAECRLMRILGADSAGMSTTAEVIVARHDRRPMRVVGLSLITNCCVDRYWDDPDAEDENEHPCHESIVETAEKRADDLRLLVAEFIGRIELARETADDADEAAMSNGAGH